MPTKCKYYSGRTINVDFFETDYCFDINTSEYYHLVLIENGSISLLIDDETVICPAPCILALKEALDVKYISSHMLCAKVIRFGVEFLNVNITFELINSGEY